MIRAILIRFFKKNQTLNCGLSLVSSCVTTEHTGHYQFDLKSPPRLQAQRGWGSQALSRHLPPSSLARHRYISDRCVFKPITYTSEIWHGCMMV